MSDVTAQKEVELALRSSGEKWSKAAEAAGIGITQLAWPSGRVTFDERSCENHGLPCPHPEFTIDDWMNTLDPATTKALADGTLLDGRFACAAPSWPATTTTGPSRSTCRASSTGWRVRER